MALPLPRAACLLLLLAAPLLCSAAAEGPISQPPSAGAPTASPLLRHPDPTAADVGEPASSPSLAPADSPANNEEKAASPPAPTPAEAPAPALSSPHSPAATPAPDNDADEDDKEKYPAPDNDADEDDKEKSPAPAPATLQVKSDKGASDGDEQPQAVDAAENERREGMSGGKKAGLVVGVFSAAAVVGLAAVVYRKRQANIRRSRYADYSARLELV